MCTYTVLIKYVDTPSQVPTWTHPISNMLPQDLDCLSPSGLGLPFSLKTWIAFLPLPFSLKTSTPWFPLLLYLWDLGYTFLHSRWNLTFSKLSQWISMCCTISMWKACFSREQPYTSCSLHILIFSSKLQSHLCNNTWTMVAASSDSLSSI